MSIKYHDNMNLPVYCPDHTLSDNWDPTADYGNEYVEVHFRINAPAYRQGTYLSFTPEEHDQFYLEVGTVFRSLGWEVTVQSAGHGCMEVRKGKANLYLHPQDFSGEMPKSEVKALAEALEKHENFSLEWVDLYETVYDMPEEEYEAYLHTQEEVIRQEVINLSRTHRRNRFYRDYSVACMTASKVRLRRVGEKDGRRGGAVKTENYIVRVISQMIDEGYLVAVTAADGSRLVRTVNKTEQRQRKLKIA